MGNIAINDYNHYRGGYPSPFPTPGIPTQRSLGASTKACEAKGERLNH